MAYCTRCQKHATDATPCKVGAFDGDRRPVRATLCTPCKRKVQASRATCEPAPASIMETAFRQ